MQILVFFLILSILVLVHELGHFITAKFFGMRVEEFGLGLPPRVAKLWTRKGTLFSLNWLPLGGFVKLYGEDMEDAEQLKSPEAFFNKPKYQRAAVLFAGVLMNFILGVGLFGVMYSYLGIPTKTDKVKLVEVRPGSPAEMAKLPLEKQIEKVISGKQENVIKTTDGFVKVIDANRGKEVQIVFLIDGKSESIKVTPRLVPPEGEGALGVALSTTEMKKYVWWQMPFRGVAFGMKEAWAWGGEILGSLGKMVGGLITGKGLPSDVSGPIGIYQVSKEVYKVGVWAVLQFMGILSINLAILNIMPFPALDGGRMMFLVVEMIIGKRNKNKIEGYAHSIGMIFLLGFMVLITIKDVIKLFVK